MGAEVLMDDLSPVGPNGFCDVIACAAKQFDPKRLLDFCGPITSRLSDWNTSSQGLRNVVTDERLFLPLVFVATDLLRVIHKRIMTLRTLFQTERPPDFRRKTFR
jgi:hypothetical protein